MTNNERFNELLNSCKNPRAVYAFLLALTKDNDREEVTDHEDQT